MKNLVFMKTHYIDDSVISEYKKLDKISSDKYDTILFIDNHTNFLNTKDNLPLKNITIDGVSIDCFVFNETVFQSCELPYYTDNPNNRDVGKIMWYNSDYPLYIIRKFLPDYDYYWSIEADVFCNGNSYEPFFKKYESDDSDLIIQDYRCFKDSDENWYWNPFSDWIYEGQTKYGSLFPVARLSGKAADFLYNRRKEHAKIFEEKSILPSSRWIFCESFVATELSNNGFKCKNLGEDKLRYQPVYNLNKERIFENPDFKLYHPVK